MFANISKNTIFTLSLWVVECLPLNLTIHAAFLCFSELKFPFIFHTPVPTVLLMSMVIYFQKSHYPG